jgi:fused signal recognition particle receptor
LALRVGLHPPAAGHVEPAEPQVDAAFIRLGAALDHRPIGLAHAAVAEQRAQMGERLAVAAEHQTARSVAVEAMGEPRRARQAEAQRVEVIEQAWTAFRPGMDRLPGRLVDDQHQAVAIEHAREHLFRCHGRLAITATIMNDSPEQRASGPRGWWQRLRQGLARSSASIGGAIADLVTKRRLDAATLEELEDVLIRADLGVAAAGRIVAAVSAGRYEQTIAADEVKSILSGEIEEVLAPVAQPLAIGAAKPFVILVVGVNGSGKTTTIGKLAARFRAEGRSVMLAAGDTFRAAAIDQLKIWGERTGVPVIADKPGSDAAGLAFEALSAARAAATDVLVVDTAGRLQNKAALMGELEKVVRVMKKLDATAPHAVLLVLDATVGQNALSQVEEFRRTAGVTGLVMTKLDGTARGGILVAIAERFGVPVHFIGVGEGVDDLQPFAARDFARAIAGLDS